MGSGTVTTSRRLASEEEILLTRSEAETVLRSHGREVKQVVRCCVDGAVLFIGALGRRYTAWIDRGRTGMTVRYEQGWSAELGANSRVSEPDQIPTLENPPEYTD